MRIKMLVCAVFMSTTNICFAAQPPIQNTKQMGQTPQKVIVLAQRGQAGQGRAARGGGGRAANAQHRRNPAYDGSRIQQYRDNHTYEDSYTFVNPIYPYGYNDGGTNYDYDNEKAKIDNPVFSATDSNGNIVYYTTAPNGSLQYFTYDTFGNKVYVDGIH